jgi:hypothetical protein
MLGFVLGLGTFHYGIVVAVLPYCMGLLGSTLLADCLAYSSTLKMEAVSSSKMINFYQNTWYHISEDSTLLLYGLSQFLFG